MSNPKFLPSQTTTLNPRAIALDIGKDFVKDAMEHVVLSGSKKVLSHVKHKPEKGDIKG